MPENSRIRELKPLPVIGSGPAAPPTRPRPAPARDEGEPASPTGGEKQIELTPIHDFARKLHQAEVLPRLAEYVRWQAALRRAEAGGEVSEAELAALAKVPDRAPISINLDLTTSCNYACDHCVDKEILNTGIKYDTDRLFDSLTLMAEKGLRSVIVIGGGEPTVHARFVPVIRHIKSLGMQVAVVSNGSGNRKIAEVADCLRPGDWVRLSLDSATDETFQAMHHPRRKITLDEICAGIRPIKEVNASFQIGFSFIITWKGAFINDSSIVENLPEIVAAARRARDAGFDYIAYKPFLTRAETNNAEIVDLHDTDAHFDEVTRRIRAAIDEAKTLETEHFKVIETTNLKVLENRSSHKFTRQPRQCHMQFFRQVLSPLGMYNCPVYRNQPHGHLGTKEAYADLAAYDETRRRTADLIRTFDATRECREVTCLYNHANWWMEDLIEHPEKLDSLEIADSTNPDYFL